MIRSTTVLLAVLTFASNVAISDIVDFPKPVGYWKLDEVFGRTAADSSGKRNHGKLMGQVHWVPDAGKFGGAAHFGDSNDCLIAISNEVINRTGTIAAWVKPSARRIAVTHLFAYSTNTPERIQLYTDNDDDWLDLGLGDKHWIHQRIVKLERDKWRHITLTWDGTQYAVYIDAAKVAAGNYTNSEEPKNRTMLHIGNDAKPHDARRPENLKPFAGLIDEVIIFDSVLSKDEVAQLCRLGAEACIFGHRLVMLFHAVKESERLLKEVKPQEAVDSICKSIREHESWMPDDSARAVLTHKQLLSDLYFLLATAKQAAGLPQAAVIVAYKHAFFSAKTDEQDRTALAWLHENIPAEQYKDVLRTFIKHNSSDYQYVIGQLGDDYKAWPALKLFLDVTFSMVSDANLAAKQIKQQLCGKNVLLRQFRDYCEDKSQLTEYVLEAMPEADEVRPAMMPALVDTSAQNAELVAWYKFDETSGGTAADSSGYGFDGTVSGPVCAPDAGKFGGAVFFDANDRKSRVQISVAKMSSKEGTVALWLKLAEPQSIERRNGYRFIFGYGAHPNRIQLYTDGNDTQLDIGLGDKHKRNKNIVDLGTNIWHHIALTWKKGNYFVHVDGTEKSAGTYSGLKHLPQDGHIGNNGTRQGGAPSAQAFHGFIDDVTVFDKALSVEDISLLYGPRDEYVGSNTPLLGLFATFRKAEALTKDKRFQSSVTLLEERLTAFGQQRKQNPDEFTPSCKVLYFDLCFLLAKTKEAAGFAKKDVVEAYRRAALNLVARSSDAVSALLWLFENTPANEYVNVIEKCLSTGNITVDNIGHIVRNFKAKGNWLALEQLFEVIFSVGSHGGAGSYAVTITEALNNDMTWNKKFLEYLENRPESTKCLFATYEHIARDAMEKGDFSRTIEIYRHILTLVNAEEEKSKYKLKICQCFFQAGRLEDTVSELNQLIIENKITHGNLIQKAILLKTRCYIMLGQWDKAIDELIAFSEYTESRYEPKTGYFVGMYYLMQDKFEEAIRAFESLVHNYPENPYAAVAHTYLKQLVRMTGQPARNKFSVFVRQPAGNEPAKVTADIDSFQKAVQGSNNTAAVTIGDLIFEQLEQKYKHNMSFVILKSKLKAAESLVVQMCSELKKAKNEQLQILALELFDDKMTNSSNSHTSIAPGKALYATYRELFSQSVDIGGLAEEHGVFLSQYYNLKLRIWMDRIARGALTLALTQPSFDAAYDFLLVLPLLHFQDMKPFNVDILPQWTMHPSRLERLSDSCLLPFGVPSAAMMLSNRSAQIRKKPFSELGFFRSAAKRCKKLYPHLAAECLHEALNYVPVTDSITAVGIEFEILWLWLNLENYVLVASQARKIFEDYPEHKDAGRAIWQYYYALSKTNDVDGILADIDNVLEDERCIAYRIKLTYIKWWALSQKHNNDPQLAALEYEVLQKYGDNPMVAPILLSRAIDLLSNRDYKSANDQLAELVLKFPFSSAATRAKEMLNKLETVASSE